MTPTDTTESGLESLICRALTGQPCDAAGAGRVGERPATYGAGWLCGDAQDYDREHYVDLAQLSAFLYATQPETAGLLGLEEDGPTRRKFLARLQGEVTKRGTVELLRKGLRHGPHRIELFYGTPSPGNRTAARLYGKNRFSVTRQLRYSNDNSQLALDLCLFVNGLPAATFELKNSLTKQTVDDAVEQYKRDRNPRERLFELGRCLAHFAVDDHEVRFCTKLAGKASWFLPFNRGWNDGAGNPPNPNGLKTDYLWQQVLTRESLTNIFANYAQVVSSKEERTARALRLADEDAEIGPVPTDGGGHKPEAEMERISNILREFNDRFGNIAWQDQDKIEKIITEELPAMVAENRAYQNAKVNSDRQNARIEHDRALERAMTGLLADHTELFKQFSDNGSFRRWLLESSFRATYDRVVEAGDG